MVKRFSWTVALAAVFAALLPGHQLWSADRDVVIVQPDGTTITGDKWALVIGCNGYDPDQVGLLSFAVADAKRMAACLVRDAGFPVENVILLTDEGLRAGGQATPDVLPTYTTLRSRMAAFAQAHQNTDVLLVFFSGHGFYSKGLKKDYLAPLDVQRNDLEGTAIPVDQVLDWLRASGARQSVLIADACRNVIGRATRDETGGVGDASLQAAQARGVWYLSSCSPGQVSREDPAKGGGIYTTCLADALQGAADGAGGHPKDGLITVSEAQAYVQARVEALTRTDPPLQTPCRSEFDVSGGEMVLSVPGQAAPPTVPGAPPTVAPPGGTTVEPGPPGGPLLLTIQAHTKWVLCVAISADGRRAVSGGMDGATRVWDVASGQEVATLPTRGPAAAAAMAANGDTVVAGTFCDSITGWSVDQARPLWAVRGENNATPLAFTPDGSEAVWYNMVTDHAMRLWSSQNGFGATTPAPRVVGGKTQTVPVAGLSADGHRALLCMIDGSMQVWDTQTGAHLRDLRSAAPANYWSAAVVAGGKRGVTLAYGAVLTAWDLEAGDAIRTIPEAGVNCMAATEDGGWAICVGGSGLLAWNLDTAASVPIAGHAGSVSAIALTPDGRRAVTGSADGKVALWDIAKAIGR